MAVLNILNFPGSIQRSCHIGAQPLIFTIYFTVLYAGYPYKIPWVGLEKSDVLGSGFEPGTF